MRWSERHGFSFTVNRKWSSDFGLWVGEFATRYPNLMKTGDPCLLPPQNCWKKVHTLLFGWHTLWQLGKDFNKQYKQQNPYTKISYNIPSNINKQTNNYIMQDHAKQGYIFGHLSLIQSLALDIPSKVATVRDLSKCFSKKRDSGTF